MKRAVFLVLFIAIGLQFSSCSLVRTLVYFQPKLETYKAFPEVKIKASEQPFRFSEVKDLNRLGKTMQLNNRKLNSKVVNLEELLDKGPTASFLIIRNDTILYEYYKNEMPMEGVVTTFSVAKSFVATLLGIAIEEGKISGIDEPITTFFPELGKKSPALKSVTLAHLLKMKSGMKQANPIALYYGNNLKHHMKKSRYKLKPDSVFAYDNANTQLLGMAIERATGKPLYQYMEEKLWKPLGAEYDITWSVDNNRDKQVKAFCCLNGRTRDFAKFGRLYLNKGNWNGKQLVPEAWVKLTAMHDPNSYSVSRYKMHWWLGNQDVGSFYANGMYNQYIWVYPRKNIVICRFSDINRETDGYWQDIFNEIVDQL
ncbi:MAG: beta-lactamase family protein [Bacteroidia bacterium]|nr:beta-lactamase family protein [Bacteroidia bacterium]